MNKFNLFRVFASSNFLSSLLFLTKERLRDAGDKPNTTVTWEPSAGDISDNMGYTWGLFSINTQNNDATVSKQHGKYATVWKRQINGSWKIVVDSFSLNPPPE